MLAHSTANSATRFHPSVSPRVDDAMPSVFSPTQMQPLSFYPAGAEIYADGGRAEAIYQVEYGAIRVYRLLADGRRQISAFHLAGEIFGFEADNAHHFFAEAITSTSLRRFRLSPGADISRDLLPLALRSLMRAQDHLLVLGRHTAIERVAAFLIDMAERQGASGHVDLPMSRMDIGDYLGLTIETVSRVFSRLKERKIIRLTNSRSVEILKWDALHQMGE
jgi:CRP/FNR family nitrogen fixation transcriptional regulator